MLKSYFRIAVRRIVRQKLYTAINVSGLAVGLAAAILILIYVQYESSYDTHFEHADRIYRLTLQSNSTDQSTDTEYSLISPAVGPSVRSAFPAIQLVARATPVAPLLSFEDRHIVASGTYWADPDLFSIFSIDVIEGDPIQALRAPFTLALSETVAKRLFGDTDPLGQSVQVNDDRDNPFEVVAVYRDMPANSHVHFQAVGSISSIERWFTGRPMDEVWDSPNYVTYALLAPGTDVHALNEQLNSYLSGVDGVNVPEQAAIRLQNITDIHLNSRSAYEMEPQGSRQSVILFALIAFVIIVIAAINFTNLSIAASSRRDREVGIRKSVGAARRELVAQFIGEAVIISVLSTTLALFLTELTLPAFSDFVRRDLSLEKFGFLRLLVWLFVGSVTIGILSGSYPALYLSRLKPSQILSGRRGTRARNSFLRSSLVTFQFSVAVVLIIATLVVFRQISFMSDQPLGFESENVVVLPEIRSIADDFEPFRQQLMLHPDIVEVSQSFRAPLSDIVLSASNATAYHPDGTTEARLFPMFIDSDYFRTFQMTVVAGRTFDRERASDMEAGLVLNVTASRRLGWRTPRDAVDEEVFFGGKRRIVLGVVQDFHQENLHKSIVPMGFYPDARNYRAISVRYQSTNLADLLDFLRSQWAPYYPNRPVEFDLLTDRLRTAYSNDSRLGTLFAAFALLGIFIACMGLFGIAAITVESRRKEIGIRKAIGASSMRIVLSLSVEFLRLSAASILVGGAAGYFLMLRWLENFAYHQAIGWQPFVLTALLIFMFSLIAVSYESISATRANPVDCLRYE